MLTIQNLKQDPALLKDEVCSPGGSTIRCLSYARLGSNVSALPFFRVSQNMGLVSSISRGVQKLEQGGVRAAFMGAVQVG